MLQLGLLSLKLGNSMMQTKKNFNITGTKTTPPLELWNKQKWEYSYITTKATNNGCDSFDNIQTENGNVIKADFAIIGYASYQDRGFSTSDHVEKLTSKLDLNQCNKWYSKYINLKMPIPFIWIHFFKFNAFFMSIFSALPPK